MTNSEDVLANLVFANCTASVVNPLTDLPLIINEGEPWSANDPFVRACPQFFSQVPVHVRRTVDLPVIEQASKAPGEKRAPRG